MSATWPDHYIGLMCGTSIDGVDVALVGFDDNKCKLVSSYLHPIDTETKERLRSLCNLNSRDAYIEGFEHRIELLGKLDHRMGHIFAESVNALLDRDQIAPQSIAAIGSHGQTIRHQPALESPFTLQLGDPNLIAYRTGIKTVADFRRMDIAAGGQGAPLAPAFHNATMRTAEESRIILNLGGIANITLLPKDPDSAVIGFDTGTANTLLDAWFMQQHPHAQDDFDRNSGFAIQGSVDQVLLRQMLSDSYFALPYPKSTGREYFSLDWLSQHISDRNASISAADVQRTLLELTVVTIADAIKSLGLPDFKVYTCGGGTHNRFLIENLEARLNSSILPCDSIGINGDYLEAMTFAWLAYQRINKRPGNLPSVTGAKTSKIMGAVYLP